MSNTPVQVIAGTDMLRQLNRGTISYNAEKKAKNLGRRFKQFACGPIVLITI